MASEEFPAVDKVQTLENQKAKIPSSLTIVGVVGTLPDCTEDGEGQCINDGVAFKAEKVSGFSESDIRSGLGVAGITGTMLDATPRSCATDGDVNCLSNAAFPAVDKAAVLQANAASIRSHLTIAGVSGALGDCSVDGTAGCVVVAPNFAATSVAGAAAKILAGQSVGGVSGSAPLRPIDCASDGQISCVAVSNYPAVNKATITGNTAKISHTLSLAGVAGTLADCASDGGTNCLAVTAYPAAQASSAAAKITSGQTVAGIAGSAPARPADCASDGQTSCVAVSNYPAINKTDLTANAGKIRSSLTLAGVAGSLADCSADGAAGCVAIGPTYAAALLTGAPAKILSGQTLAGIAGSAAIRPADCSNDGGTNCVAVIAYPAANASTARQTVEPIA